MGKVLYGPVFEGTQGEEIQERGRGGGGNF